MAVSIILGHPRRDSFCHSIADAAAATLRANGYAVALHDLYAESFDPLVGAEESRTRVSTDPLVERHCAELAEAEGLIVIHPNWWGQPPAMLKGWIDRVVRPGVAYDLAADSSGARTKHVGLLRARAVLVFNTSDSPLEVEQTRFGNTLEVIWRTYIADLCGIGEMKRILFSVMGASSPEQRAAWLSSVRTTIDEHFPAA